VLSPGVVKKGNVDEPSDGGSRSDAFGENGTPHGVIHNLLPIAGSVKTCRRKILVSYLVHLSTSV